MTILQATLLLACLSCQATQVGDDAQANPTAGLTDQQQFLQTQLRALLSFKDAREFHAVGFSPAHKYRRWYDVVAAKRLEKGLTLQEAEALGHLEQLGREYCRTRGTDNEYSVFAKQVIEEAVGAPRPAIPAR